MSTPYEEYAIIESEIAVLEARKEKLRPQIVSDMNKIGTTNLDMGVGSFVIAKLKKWTYPKKVVEIEKELKSEISTLNDEIKSAKAKAESTGEATYEESDSLRFTAVKL